MHRRELMAELWERRGQAAEAAHGRYEGAVKRDSDNAEFLRAIELGTRNGNRQPIKIFEQLGGQLPDSPQFEGDAFVFRDALLFFSTSDSVADRRYISLMIAGVMLSFSRSIFDDDRGTITFSGILRPI